MNFIYQHAADRGLCWVRIGGRHVIGADKGGSHALDGLYRQEWRDKPPAYDPAIFKDSPVREATKKDLELLIKEGVNHGWLKKDG